MDISSRRMYGFLKKMDFVRLSTTDGEAKGRDVILGELEASGIPAVTESFKVPKYTVKTAKFEVLEPRYKEYTVTGYGCSGSTAEGGLEAEFAYVEDGAEIDLLDARGKIVLVTARLDSAAYERLVKAGVAGFVTASGNFYDDRQRTDLDERMLRETHTKFGRVPGVCMRMADVIKLVASKPGKVRLTLSQDEEEGESCNIIAQIDGSKYPEEIVCYTAHYDSVVFSHGMFDNAAGSAIILELCKYYSKIRPLRTLRFIWCGSEERGLYGSKAYVKAHSEELEKIRLSINVDLAGPVIGRDTAIVLAEDKLCHMIEYMYKEVGHPMNVRHDIYSSDCIPFADAGVPAVNFVRFASSGAAACHLRQDNLTPLSGEALKYTGDFVRAFSERVVNARMFPVGREIPEDIRKKLDKYLNKGK